MLQQRCNEAANHKNWYPVIISDHRKLLSAASCITYIRGRGQSVLMKTAPSPIISILLLRLLMYSMKLVIPLHSLYWSIHTKDESKRGTAFAFIFGVN